MASKPVLWLNEEEETFLCLEADQRLQKELDGAPPCCDDSTHDEVLLSEFPSADSRLPMFRRNLQANRGQCWDDNWDQNVLPLLTSSK